MLIPRSMSSLVEDRVKAADFIGCHLGGGEAREWRGLDFLEGLCGGRGKYRTHNIRGPLLVRSALTAALVDQLR
ncbi:hypothetical protein MATL_G00025740 [Megalops atlanticus]|uniref:Uncharacterized protein n=1 Tax=Megalops atlanticus TaxID=7932 RepID=A0A9D3TCI3_MEGAT|nr:hypothetical protein MATL_G00025740 [Megalops atlanticus]